MTEVPKRIIKHTLNVNMSVPSVAQKPKVLGTEKSLMVMKEVEEWVKAISVRPIRYPTWISNLILVNKVDDAWANPKKTKEVADMWSPKMLKEMQSLSGKLKALNRFLAGYVKRSLSFFETLKNIMKDNKDDFRRTKDTERALQEMKKLIMHLPSLTTPKPKDILYVYLVASQDVVSGVFLAEREGKQTPI
uniref:Protein NYNRIN-like n=1 Tax=Tanacetum cinerariifolium TaxID=118510 RepID=A0A6L2P628_TANCI|nr:protein NYNRIN-like [Tanacetum cinerariifolium]